SLCQPPSVSSGLPVLTHVIQVRQLTREQARHGYPVHLKAVVTYFDTTPAMFIQDGTGGTFVDWEPGLPKPQPGQLVDLWGTTTQLDFAPDIAKPHWKVTGRAPLPRAKRVTFEEMASTSVDARWVEVEGIVRSAEVAPNEGSLRLMLVVPGGRVVVSIPSQPVVPRGLVDSKVRLLGVCGAIFNQKNQIIGVTLSVPSIHEITTVEAGAGDPFAGAAHPIATLQTFTFTGLPAHRVKVSGVVTASFPGGLYITDKTGSVFIESSQTVPLRPGDRVEVVGFAGFVEYRPILKDAICRRTSSGSPPTPIRIQADHALDDDGLDSALAILEAQLTVLEVLPNELVLILHQGKTTFSAIVSRSSGGGEPSLREGSRVQITGICIIEKDAAANLQSFQLRLRSFSDIQVIANPSWWTRDRAVSLLLVVWLAMLVTSVWVFVLRRRVQSQTHELIRKNEELATALNTATEATRLKSEFLANMSHEIRTPMNAILGLTELALDNPSPEEQQEYLRDVLDSAESLLSLLNDILDLSKVEAGRLELEPVPTSIAQRVQDATEFLRTAAARKGLELEWSVSPDVPKVLLGDPLRLRQVLLNLIGNAIKFTETGRVTVQAQLESEDRQSVCLRFAVHDTGPGIPAEKQALIFKSFCQADGSPTRRHGGTGLGLTISSHLVQLMGGRIWVESEPGSGSTFFFTVNFGTVPDAPSKPQPEISVSPTLASAAKSQLGSLHILVAEDNFSNLKLLTRLLERWGQRVTLAVNGREALDLLEKNTFDLLVLDLQMPEMDGFEVTAAIRKNEQVTGKHLPILALTAHALAHHREQCLSHGMDGFLAKPIELRKLLEALVAVTASAKLTNTSRT
ncbi:MAG TPA: ATP-binding protein, partial [Alphaproteobacteria bacterium]|nr:ATP-binding protein [Alphaproteobacteria bacterium]